MLGENRIEPPLAEVFTALARAAKAPYIEKGKAEGQFCIIVAVGEPKVQYLEIITKKMTSFGRKIPVARIYQNPDDPSIIDVKWKNFIAAGDNYTYLLSVLTNLDPKYQELFFNTLVFQAFVAADRLNRLVKMAENCSNQAVQ